MMKKKMTTAISMMCSIVMAQSIGSKVNSNATMIKNRRINSIDISQSPVLLAISRMPRHASVMPNAMHIICRLDMPVNPVKL